MAAQIGSSFSSTLALLCVCSTYGVQYCGMMGKTWPSCPTGDWTSLAMAHLKIPQLHSYEIVFWHRDQHTASVHAIEYNHWKRVTYREVFLVMPALEL